MPSTRIRLLPSIILADRFSSCLSANTKLTVEASGRATIMSMSTQLLLALVFREVFLSFEAPLMSDSLVILCSLEVGHRKDNFHLFSFEDFRSLSDLCLCVPEEEAADLSVPSPSFNTEARVDFDSLQSPKDADTWS